MTESNKETRESIAFDMRSRDNRIFLVQVLDKTYMNDVEASDGFDWVDCEYDAIDYFNTAIPDDADSRESIEVAGVEYTRAHYVSHWRVLQHFFTERSANDYLKQNAHNIKNKSRVLCMPEHQTVFPVMPPEDKEVLLKWTTPNVGFSEESVRDLQLEVDRLKDELGHAYEALARHLRGRS